jgi:hypothetical protein
LQFSLQAASPETFGYTLISVVGEEFEIALPLFRQVSASIGIGRDIYALNYFSDISF